MAGADDAVLRLLAPFAGPPEGNGTQKTGGQCLTGYDARRSSGRSHAAQFDEENHARTTQRFK